MPRPSILDVAIVLGAVASAGALTVLESQGIPELVFYSVMLVVLAYVGQLALRAARLARAERGRADELVETPVSDVALAAVRDERRRLAADIAASLREALTRILAETGPAAADADPRAPLRRIHENSQRATSELRRHLGLLRGPGTEPSTPVAREGSAGPVPRRDLVLGSAMVVLAAVESAAYSSTEGPPDWSWWSVGCSALAASTVLGRSVALGASAALCGVIYGMAAVLGTPVVNGFWSVGTIGVLLWSIAARPRPAGADLAGGVVLVVSLGVSGWVADRDNVGIMLVVASVAIVGGLGAGRGRRREAAARRVAASREEELRSAARTAVTAERTVFARELHDVVSHAVGVIAVQAGAAMVSWPRDLAARRRAVDVIAATAESALAELDRLQPDHHQQQRSVEDLESLVGRIRAAGTDVDLTLVGVPSPMSAVVVYRIVQESLTNVVRHAPGAAVSVTVRCDTGRTLVRVVDDGPGPDGAGGRGYGLVGLAERVGFAGGTLRTGAGPGGTGFLVEAMLPARIDAVTP